jgi:hypothetical protein
MKEERHFLQDYRMLRISEMFVWFFVAVVASGRFWFMGLPAIERNFSDVNIIGDVLKFFYFDILLGLLFFIFPIILTYFWCITIRRTSS